jgi:hypothetical protein
MEGNSLCDSSPSSWVQSNASAAVKDLACTVLAASGVINPITVAFIQAIGRTKAMLLLCNTVVHFQAFRDLACGG